MKIINTLSGGYRRVMDTLLGLQTEMVTMGNAPFAALGVDLVLSGCAVTDNGDGTVNIAPGLMYVAGNTLRFDGAGNIASDGSMAITAGAVVASNPQPFADGSTQNIYSEQKAVVAAMDTSNTQQIIIKTTLYSLQQYIQDQVNANEPTGTIKELYDFDGTFRSNFDASGLGNKPAWMGWALDNGNNGTPGSAGRVLIGVGVNGSNTYSYGDVGGEINHQLSVDEMPSHNHSYNIRVFSGGTYSDTTDTGHSTSDNAMITGNTGGDNPHNNMQPYKVVYRVVKVGVHVTTGGGGSLA
jgi:hypothetical protein